MLIFIGTTKEDCTGSGACLDFLLKFGFHGWCMDCILTLNFWRV